MIADPDEGSRRGTGRGISALVPTLPPTTTKYCAGTDGSLPPGLLLHSLKWSKDNSRMCFRISWPASSSDNADLFMMPRDVAQHFPLQE